MHSPSTIVLGLSSPRDPISSVVGLLIGLLVGLFAGLPAVAHAQTSDSTAVDPPECARATAEAYLEVGNVRAKILNNGALFWNGGAHVYEVPKGGGVDAIFNAVLWLGGIVEEEVRASTSNYGPWEFWPGPIAGPTPVPDLCAEYDRIWEVRREDLQGGRLAERAISSWPVDYGAPFIDVDGDGAYRPETGDRPELLGDQQLWWIMNDAGGIHIHSKTEPLGVEVRATAFAFNMSGVVGNSTFYRYLIRNKSPHPIMKSYAGIFTDIDLGAAHDDYVGSDSTLGMGYSYNGDNDDDKGYGIGPPAIGFTVLTRPQSSLRDASACSYPDDKSIGFTNMMAYPGGPGIYGQPREGSGFYNFMQSRWRNGQPLTLGGPGYDFSHTPTRFFYPGDPVTGSYWSEVNRDDSGNSNAPADKRIVSSLGPFCIAPGEEVELVVAIVWSRGSSNLDSVRQLREDVAYIQSIRDVILTPRELPVAGGNGIGSASGPELPFAASVYPNPVGGGVAGSGGGHSNATVRFSTPEPLEVSVIVFNALGQRVSVAVEPGLVDAGDYSWTLPTTEWPPGVYLIRITAGHTLTTRQLVVT